VTDRIPQEDITDGVTPEVVETLCQYLNLADQAYDCGTKNNLKKLLEEHGEPVLHAKPQILSQHHQHKMNIRPTVAGPTDPNTLDLDIHVPLKEVGITDLEEIPCRGRHHQQLIISTSEHCRNFEKVVRKRHMIAFHRLTLLLNNSFEHHNVMAYVYTSSTDLLIEQRQIHLKHAITQIHPVLTRGDQQTLQECLRASYQQIQPMSPGSRMYLDLATRKRKRALHVPMPDMNSVSTIEYEYELYEI